MLKSRPPESNNAPPTPGSDDLVVEHGAHAQPGALGTTGEIESKADRAAARAAFIGRLADALIVTAKALAKREDESTNK